MTRLVLVILILSTFVVAGILFSPKQATDAADKKQASAWQEKPKESQLR